MSIVLHIHRKAGVVSQRGTAQRHLRVESEIELILTDCHEGGGARLVKADARRLQPQHGVPDELVVLLNRGIEVQEVWFLIPERETVHRQRRDLDLREGGDLLLEVGCARAVDYGPVVIPLHRLQECLAAQQVMASVLRAEAQEHYPPHSLLVLDEIAVTCALYLLGLAEPAEIGQDGVVRVGLVGAVYVTAARNGDTMAVLRTAFCNHQVIPSVLLVDVRSLGIASAVALPEQFALGQLLAGVDVYFTEIQAVARIADHIGLSVLEVESRVDAALLQPDGIRPFSGRVVCRHEEIAFSRDIGRDHVKSTVVIADGGSINASAAIGILEVKL